MDMQRKVRDEKFRLGLLKPDTFAEDRLLRQPPGVCIMLVMYNRYHNYAATQLKRINENGRFSLPAKFEKTKLLAMAEDWACVPSDRRDPNYRQAVRKYTEAWDTWFKQSQKPLSETDTAYEKAEVAMRKWLEENGVKTEVEKFEKAYEAAWTKLDDDLFNTARLITCGIYVNISIHDYLRALMGFHQYNTNFTLDPRINITDHKNVSRGLGNQVTVEFNLLYRFHCAISQKDEQYTESLMTETMKEVAAKVSEKAGQANSSPGSMPDVKNLSMMEFAGLAAALSGSNKKEPWLQEFGLKNDKSQSFKRNTVTGLFDDQQMINQLCQSMNDPISNFGPKNVPRSLKNVEVMGMLQARKWEIGTLNDFREFFQMPRHKTFQDISKNVEIQNALRDLYDHPDKVELYPGVFCESAANMDLDPGPSDTDSALWAAIFSDAITLVRSDRFYTVDWNTNSLTSWGMKEVTPDMDNLKSSVFHRLLQRAFPEWYPYDTVRFFHPFYTAQQNATFAEKQGYGKSFQVKANPAPSPKPKDNAWDKWNCQGSEPQKPLKPVLLTDYDEINAVLATGADEIVHPALTKDASLPPKIQQALYTIRAKSTTMGDDDRPQSAKIIRAYFAEQTRVIIEREAITMDPNTFQVDVTRDVAIPVVTRCIADFLGFGSQVRHVGNLNAKYSENEIYQHITNCQVFLSYNTDETKLIKRRTAFKDSMAFLLKLAEEGNILEASRWGVTKTIRGLFKDSPTSAQDMASEPMRALGRSVATRILKDENDSGKAAAILLLTALDIAYISVLAFTTVLDHLLGGAYDAAKTGGSSSDWFDIQALALKDDEKSDQAILIKVLEAQRQSVKLPFIRKVVKEGGTTINVNGQKSTLEKGQMIICDIYSAMKALSPTQIADTDRYCHLNYVSSLSTPLIHFNPKDIALHGLVAMIKHVALLRDLRRGHTSQGQVKRIKIDQTYEGYANFMAPGRMEQIAYDAKHAGDVLEEFREGMDKSSDMSEGDKAARLKWLEKRVEDARGVFSEGVLKPEVDTYLTAEWDEMVPFPT
ncbi:MAG: hypothetical protein Q9174_005832, partial [Haloplaca sp. 1 TL-2023]